VVGYSLRNIKVSRPGVEEQQVSIDPMIQPLRALRAKHPTLPIIGGGCAFGLYAQPLMERLPELDVGLVGEAERALPELIEHLDQPWRVAGAVYRREGRVIGGDVVAPPPDFAALPAPDRRGISLTQYTTQEYAVGVQSKRGCALRCLHCSDLFLTGGRVRMRDPSEVVDEIEELVRGQGLESFQFVDQVFNLPPSHAREICTEMTDRGLRPRWTAWFTSRGLNDDFLRVARRAGLTVLQLSPDSTNDQVLEALHKPDRRRDLVEATRAAARVGVPVSLSFFYPNPRESLRSTVDLVRFLAARKLEMGPRLWLHGRMVVRTRVYPHSELHEQMVRDGEIPAEHDLIDPVYYEPQPFRAVARGIQTGLRGVYDLRLRLKRLGWIRPRR
jgi:5-methoxybenzimidazole methyltransferase